MNRLKINGIILALLTTLSISTFLVSCGSDEKVNNTKENTTAASTEENKPKPDSSKENTITAKDYEDGMLSVLKSTFEGTKVEVKSTDKETSFLITAPEGIAKDLSSKKKEILEYWANFQSTFKDLSKELVNKAKEANYKKEVSLSVLSDTDKNTILLTVKNGEVTHDITKK